MTIARTWPRPWRRAAAPEHDHDDPLVTELITAPLVTIAWDAGLATALKLMAENRVRHLPVLDRVPVRDRTRCLGLLHESDVVDQLISGPVVRRWMRPIAEIVRPSPTVAATARRSEVARVMQETGADAVLVTAEDQLVGVVTTTDLLRSLAGVFVQVDDELEEEIAQTA
jgi:CBS domain-containing protein